ncbi:hypothetical protein SSX86_003708 [Deinandra increscens subsp. villosa]|uniref:SWIM-type domain-containing protein n=1 Tax=Deinandra increscens subsp. villosa TaxID=3103831 RepID=A0AAP0DHS0_9ASTR
MDKSELIERSEEQRYSDSDVFVDATSEFDINFIDTHGLIEHEPQSSSSAGQSSSSMHTITEPEPDMTFFAFEHHGGVSSRLFLTPNGTKFWKPNVSDSIVPVVGTVFACWEDVVSLYESYAEKAGFSTRLGTCRVINDVITSRYILCNRSGKPRFKNYDSTNPETLSSSRTSRSLLCGCKACIRAKYDPETGFYTLYTFVESHNHELIGKEFMEFSKKRRKTDYTTHQFVHEMSLNKIGPNVAHRLQCTLKGGHHNVRGTTTDYKNISRAIRLFIGDRDAQMVLDTLRARTENLHNFFFEYSIVGHELRSLFWADDVSRCNYETFGDVLAFDATYKTNKYCMIFVPFTGVDHHKRCVTFGAGLLSDETTESYTWLLERFLQAHVKQPRLVLTDQDSAMAKAVLAVFKESKHRLCMWHIMRKLPSKIKGDDVQNNALRKSIHKLVWNLILDESMFEQQWKMVIDEYGVSDNDWLQSMYAIRSDWVPCYFREFPMCCLMKTTSRCESSNALFKVNSSASNTLLQFLMCFDTAIDGQRYNQRKMEFETNMTTPVLHTHTPIERQASMIYTSTIFKEVQKELDRSAYHCAIIETRTFGNKKVYTVSHSNRHFIFVNQFEVIFDMVDRTFECSCMCFTRIGYLCRHVFHVFRSNQIHEIPARYVYARWKRNALPARVHDIANRYSVDNSEAGVLRREIVDVVSQCTDRLRREPERLATLLNQLKDIKKTYFRNSSLQPPQGIRNKGCGTDSRLIGPGEKAIEQFKKGPRMCKKCKKLVYDHDSRNCDKIQAAKRAASNVDGTDSAGIDGHRTPSDDINPVVPPPVQNVGPSAASSSCSRPVRATRRSVRLAGVSPAP